MASATSRIFLASYTSPRVVAGNSGFDIIHGVVCGSQTFDHPQIFRTLHLVRRTPINSTTVCTRSILGSVGGATASGTTASASGKQLSTQPAPHPPERCLQWCSEPHTRPIGPNPLLAFQNRSSHYCLTGLVVQKRDSSSHALVHFSCIGRLTLCRGGSPPSPAPASRERRTKPLVRLKPALKQRR